ncbi:hypothetical protein [Frigoribacterium salinisoli]
MSSITASAARRSASPFSEVRATERQATFAVVATSAVAASTSIVAALLVSLGVIA